MRPEFGQLRSYSTLPHSSGPWAVGILLCTASLPEGTGQWKLLYTASLGSGQQKSVRTLPH